jgi:hypothetical protein
MIETVQQAKSALEAQGLHVSLNNPSSLLIGGSVTASGNGLSLFKDASALNRRAETWVAVFPADGLLTYEVPGGLPDLVPLIVAVYAEHRRAGGQLSEAFRQVVGNPEQYLVGHPLARV